MSRPPLDKNSETVRLHLKITATELEQIDDWRFANRSPSRSEAIRRLIVVGLEMTQEVGDK